MPSPSNSERTSFSLDVLGRYICNGLDEAIRNSDPSGRRPDGSPQNDARPFDIIVVGGGTFAAATAAHIFSADIAHRHRHTLFGGRVVSAGGLCLASCHASASAMGHHINQP
jgi:hypothetical protein